MKDSAHLFSGSGVTTRLRDGRSVTVRAATARDAGDVSAMHLRCSTETVRHRYHSVPPMTGRFLAQLVGTEIALVAVAPNRAVVALANLGRDDGDAGGAGELAVVVEDRWQRAGLGATLLDHLVDMARLVGYHEVYTVGLPGNRWYRTTLARHGRTRLERSDGYDAMRLSLRSPPDRLPEELGASAAA
ncbi:GNAT family N-acetyltransferase [Jiangella muralis]|uniref:GNAT family N-acetyltransferase n=1 Tax=Jiangella muralis TaxID=702383 RepID=UPI00069F3301|nr:GNAT family N-acetyltransferase [Jiangella muralis]